MTRLEAAFAKIAEANADDPRSVEVDGAAVPYEALYARRMTAQLAVVAPDASEALQLAVRAQHIRRWTIARDAYPRDRRGYLAWRRALGAFHAETAATVLSAVGYDNETVARVGALIRKEGLGSDAEAQALEDTACLAFLDFCAEDFAAEQDEAAVVRILGRTWAKTSAQGRALARQMTLPVGVRELLERALSESA